MNDPVEPAARGVAPRWSRWAASAGLGLSAALGLGLAVGYVGRFDAWAAVTVFPVWAWLVPGLLLAAPGWRRRGGRPVAAGWLLFVLGLAEEPWSLLRQLAAPGHTEGRPGRTLRVVSLNCAIGSPRAAEEVVPARPDVVLLQESPGRRDVEALAARLFGPHGCAVAGPDASLIVHGRADPADLPPTLRSYFVQARVRLASGLEAEVISTRLVPAVFRLDLWSPDCWREQAANRRRRREQVRAIARRIASIPADVPVIVGGDFNAPQGDAALRSLGPRVRDTFRDGGRGWGNTILNDVPFLRIDQVWASRDLVGTRVVARTTRHSDHRMVVCDLELVSPPPAASAASGPPGETGAADRRPAGARVDTFSGEEAPCR